MVYVKNTGGPLDTLAVAYGYDNFLRRTNLVALKSNNPLVQQSFGFDAASRLQTVSDGTMRRKKRVGLR